MNTILTFPDTEAGFNKWLQICAYLCECLRYHEASYQAGVWFITY